MQTIDLNTKVSIAVCITTIIAVLLLVAFAKYHDKPKYRIRCEMRCGCELWFIDEKRIIGGYTEIHGYLFRERAEELFDELNRKYNGRHKVK